MFPLLQGIQTGLVLCIMLGPIFFALVQAGVERGMRAGLMVGLGIWISDLIFILSIFFGASFIVTVTEWEGFKATFGAIGGLILIGFGIGMMFTKSPPLPTIGEGRQEIGARTYLGLWVKGFLINTVNPFTFFFWLSVMSLILLAEDSSDNYAYLFFIGVMGTIIFTDALKVALAKFIRRYMTNRHIHILRMVSGGALVVFGIVLMVKVFFL
jgi:Putative threonine efflux protein